jgi:Acyltransferase family
LQLSLRSSLPSLSARPLPHPERRRLSIIAKPEPLDRNHLFANNIRFWSMVSIVAVHCINSPQLLNWSSWQIRLLFTAPFKFGTIGFFLVSGFLMGERVDRRDPFDYFTRRTNKVTLAWLFWFVMFVSVYAVNRVIHQGLVNISAVGILRSFGIEIWSCLWYSPFWFVPNFLLCIAVLLIFRRYLYTVKLGACLLAVNLVYAVNIYGLWFPSRHTQALFGFVFYLWLGSYIAHNFEKARLVLDKISFTVSVALALFTCILALGESYWLTLLRNPDPVNTLRFSNQLFSLALVLILFKLSSPSWPRFVDVRRHTFGLYLSHTIVMTVFVRLFKGVHRSIGTVFPVFGVDYVFAVFLLFVLTYLTCLAITEAIARRSSLLWMVGLSRQKHAPPSVPGLFDSPACSKT